MHDSHRITEELLRAATCAQLTEQKQVKKHGDRSRKVVATIMSCGWAFCHSLVGEMPQTGRRRLPQNHNASELRLTILVLDLLNTSPLQRTDGKDDFIKFL